MRLWRDSFMNANGAFEKGATYIIPPKKDRPTEADRSVRVQKKLSKNDPQRDDVQFAGHFAGCAELPGIGLTAHRLGHAVGDALNVDDGMTGEDFRQAVRQIAGETFPWPLGQLEFHVNGVVVAADVSQSDIVAPFFGITEKSFEKSSVRSAGNRDNRVSSEKT